LQTSLENELDTIDQSYEDIERTSVVVDIPERDDIKRVFQDEWLSEIESLKRELPMLDFGSQSEDIRRTQQEDWQQVIAETRNELQSLRAFADDLSKFSDQINQIENIRDNTRQEFHQIHDKIQ
jgi:nucleosome binding factor SPN SPT16 subunit